MNKYKSIFLIAFLAIAFNLNAQKFFTRDGKVSFHSDAPLEKIEAHNAKGTSVIDLETGNLEFAVLIKAFQFEKALMQEHFNENYMESDKFPKAVFKGSIVGYEKGMLDDDGKQTVQVEGTITIHGVEQPITATATLERKGDTIAAASSFVLKPEDFDIEIPNVVRDNIAKEVEVKLDLNYEAFNK